MCPLTTQTAGDEAEEAKELALAEQARRNYRKVADWQEDGGVVYKIVVWQLGDIFVVAVPGEPYSELQVRSPAETYCRYSAETRAAVCKTRRHLPAGDDPRGSTREACHCVRQHKWIINPGLHPACGGLWLWRVPRQNRGGALSHDSRYVTSLTSSADSILLLFSHFAFLQG